MARKKITAKKFKRSKNVSKCIPNRKPLPDKPISYAVFYKIPAVKIPQSFQNDYCFVTTIKALGPEVAYQHMQGHNWSPNGEAREKIESLGLDHTSMHIGDLLVEIETGRKLIVDIVGFEIFVEGKQT